MCRNHWSIALLHTTNEKVKGSRELREQRSTAMIIDPTAKPLNDLIRLDGRVAVVTGGATGIGRGIAARLAEAGATVVAADVDGAQAEQTAEELNASGSTAVGRQVDVADSRAIATLADAVNSEFGSLDIWINNAGVYPAKPFLEMTDEDWRSVMSINLDGAMFGAREAARQMVANQSGGTIVNIVSVSGYRGRPSLAHYSASKHALRGLTRSLAVELGHHGIRVLAIAPTMVTAPGPDPRQTGQRTGRQETTGNGVPRETHTPNHRTLDATRTLRRPPTRRSNQHFPASHNFRTPSRNSRAFTPGISSSLLAAHDCSVWKINLIAVIRIRALSRSPGGPWGS
mgnify:CR=1 FL=1